MGARQRLCRDGTSREKGETSEDVQPQASERKRARCAGIITQEAHHPSLMSTCICVSRQDGYCLEVTTASDVARGPSAGGARVVLDMPARFGDCGQECMPPLWRWWRLNSHSHQSLPSRTRPVRMKRWLPAGLFPELPHVRWAAHPSRGPSLAMSEEGHVYNSARS
jgi:hypothetical protein